METFRLAALELNTEAFLRICTPDPVSFYNSWWSIIDYCPHFSSLRERADDLKKVIWEKFGWVGKDVHAIISQIAESGLPK